MIIVKNDKSRFEFRRSNKWNYRKEIVYFLLDTRMLHIRLGIAKWFRFYFCLPNKYTTRGGFRF